MNSEPAEGTTNSTDADFVKLLAGIEMRMATWVAGDPSFHEQILDDERRVLLTARVAF
jgi:hypothetical protein